MKIVSLPKLVYYCFKERQSYDLSSLIENLKEGDSFQIAATKEDSYSLGTYVFPKCNLKITKDRKVSQCHFLWLVERVETLVPTVFVIKPR